MSIRNINNFLFNTIIIIKKKISITRDPNTELNYLMLIRLNADYYNNKKNNKFAFKQFKKFKLLKKAQEKFELKNLIIRICFLFLGGLDL